MIQTLTQHRRIVLGFFLISVAPMLIGILTWRAAQAMFAASRQVALNNELMMSMEQLLSSLKDMQVATREFVITGDEAVARVASLQREPVNVQLARVATYTQDQHWVEILQGLIPEFFDEVDTTIQARRDMGSKYSAAALTNAGQGRLDDIRTAVRRMIEDETRRLARNSESQHSNLGRVFTLAGLLLVLNLIFVWVIYVGIRREARRVREANVELERRVAARTEELQLTNEQLRKSNTELEYLRMIRPGLNG